MKTSLDHLPADKQEKLKKITSLIRELADPEMVILYGSHATGKWVNDQYVSEGIVFTYDSDFDILVVLKNGSKIKDYEIESFVEDKCHFKEAVNIVSHDLDYLNRALSKGWYFFCEIYRQGIILLAKEGVSVNEPIQPNLEQVKENAIKDLNLWHTSGTNFLKMAEYSMDKSIQSGEGLKELIFILHQAAEKFYNALILVNTGYKTKTHNLYRLQKKAKPFSSRLIQLFSITEEPRLFDLLKKGYLEARYDPSYTVKPNEVIDIFQKVKQMAQIVYEDSVAKINTIL